MTATRAQALIETLQLQPHPEGGWYREVFRSGSRVTSADGRPPRDALTSICFLLEAGRCSRHAAGPWQAARPIVAHSSGDYSLTACMVGPGFDFADFSFMAPDGEEATLLRHHWSDLVDLI